MFNLWQREFKKGKYRRVNTHNPGKIRGSSQCESTDQHICQDLDPEQEYKFKVKAYTRYESDDECEDLSSETDWSAGVSVPSRYSLDHVMIVLENNLPLLLSVTIGTFIITLTSSLWFFGYFGDRWVCVFNLEMYWHVMYTIFNQRLFWKIVAFASNGLSRICPGSSPSTLLFEIIIKYWLSFKFTEIWWKLVEERGK